MRQAKRKGREMKTSKAKVNKKIREVRFDLARAVDCVSYYGKADWADLHKADARLELAIWKLPLIRQELKKLIAMENTQS